MIGKISSLRQRGPVTGIVALWRFNNPYKRRSPAVAGSLSGLLTLWFSCEFEHVFPELWITLNTCDFLLFGFVLFFSYLFSAGFCFASCLFSKFHGSFAVWIYVRRNLGMLLCNFACFGLVYPDLHVFLFCSIFVWNAFWACFSVKLLIWACFYKITCDHCSVSWWPDKMMC